MIDAKKVNTETSTSVAQDKEDCTEINHDPGLATWSTMAPEMSGSCSVARRSARRARIAIIRMGITVAVGAVLAGWAQSVRGRPYRFRQITSRLKTRQTIRSLRLN
jgi:hypothetical protein